MALTPFIQTVYRLNCDRFLCILRSNFGSLAEDGAKVPLISMYLIFALAFSTGMPGPICACIYGKSNHESCVSQPGTKCDPQLAQVPPYPDFLHDGLESGQPGPWKDTKSTSQVCGQVVVSHVGSCGRVLSESPVAKPKKYIKPMMNEVIVARDRSTS